MPGRNFAPDLGLPITLDRAAPTSIYQQLCEQFRRAILDGRISSGTRLPSTRTLAQALGVSCTVTSSAYDELFAEGDLEGRHGVNFGITWLCPGIAQRGSSKIVTACWPAVPQREHSCREAAMWYTFLKTLCFEKRVRNSIEKCMILR